MLKTKYYFSVVDFQAVNLLAGSAYPVIWRSLPKKIFYPTRNSIASANSNYLAEIGFSTHAVE